MLASADAETSVMASALRRLGMGSGFGCRLLGLFFLQGLPLQILVNLAVPELVGLGGVDLQLEPVGHLGVTSALST